MNTAASTYEHHDEAEGVIPLSNAALFAYLDRHSQLAGHMTKRSWMMGGGRMDITTDEGAFQKVGSRLRLAGRAFGLKLVLDEAVTVHKPPLMKVWETIGTPQLLVIGGYRMGFEITPEQTSSRLRVFIDYDLPRSTIGRFLGYLFAAFYAGWCVKSMVADAGSALSRP
jgi:hypothetical protein